MMFQVRERERMLNTKAIYCKFEVRPGGCKYADRCMYRHLQDNAEANRRELSKDQSRRHQRKGQLCKFERTKGGCRFGDACHYKHVRFAADVKEEDDKKKREVDPNRMRISDEDFMFGLRHRRDWDSLQSIFSSAFAEGDKEFMLFKLGFVTEELFAKYEAAYGCSLRGSELGVNRFLTFAICSNFMSTTIDPPVIFFPGLFAEEDLEYVAPSHAEILEIYKSLKEPWKILDIAQMRRDSDAARSSEMQNESINFPIIEPIYGIRKLCIAKALSDETCFLICSFLFDQCEQEKCAQNQSSLQRFTAPQSTGRRRGKGKPTKGKCERCKVTCNHKNCVRIAASSTKCDVCTKLTCGYHVVEIPIDSEDWTKMNFRFMTPYWIESFRICNDLFKDLKAQQQEAIQDGRHRICFSCLDGNVGKSRGALKLTLQNRLGFCPGCRELLPTKRGWGRCGFCGVMRCGDCTLSSSDQHVSHNDRRQPHFHQCPSCQMICNNLGLGSMINQPAPCQSPDCPFQ